MAKTFLVLGLAIAPAFSAPTPTLSPARQQAIESHMANWMTVKARDKRLTDAFLSGISASPKYSLVSYKAQVATMMHVCQSREQKENGIQQTLLGQLAQQVSQGRLTPTTSGQRSAGLNKIFQLRMLYVYGNLLPQMLDTSVQPHGVPEGRNLAGPDWQLELTDAEVQALFSQYLAASGFAESDVGPN